MVRLTKAQRERERKVAVAKSAASFLLGVGLLVFETGWGDGRTIVFIAGLILMGAPVPIANDYFKISQSDSGEKDE